MFRARHTISSSVIDSIAVQDRMRIPSAARSMPSARIAVAIRAG